MTIATLNPVCIDHESLEQWLLAALRGRVPDNSQVSIIHREWEAKGESRFFSCIDVDMTLSIEALLTKVATKYSRGPYLHFYADDVVAAACGAGELSGNWFWLYYKW